MLFATLIAPAASRAAEDSAAPYVGRPVAEVVDEIRDQGYKIAYSSNLVPVSLLVEAEPETGDPIGIVLEILLPHGLTLRPDAGVYLIVRAGEASVPANGTPAPPGSNVAAPEIENITVSASRYEISRDIAGSRTQLDQRTIQNMPDVGEDPVRITQRLPGVAASGASARAHFRGGEQGEVGIILNGQRLFDPYHVRDYQNIFSAIDSRAIDGVEVYTGGFPVRFGDRMSGLVLMDSLDSEKDRHTELGLSVFNTSALIAGKHSNKRWLFSARRGNLDLVINPRLGEPSYFDTFAQFEIDVSPDMTVSANALYADDQVQVVLESDPDEVEQAQSQTRNIQLWLQLENRWSDRLSSSTVLSAVSYENLREGSTDDIEKIIAVVRDERDIEQIGLRQDWTFLASDRHLLQWGLNITQNDAVYDYTGAAEYFELQALFEGQPDSLTRSASAAPSGASYAVYLSDRWKFGDRTVLEWGLRWDDQTYTSPESDSQLSPRLTMLHGFAANTELRLSWGRYHQSQSIQNLQIEDGILQFWPAQRADHWIAGLRHKLSENTSFRLELFYKDLGDIRPRFENLYDPLGLIPELQPDRVRLDPTGAKSSGVELSMDGSNGRLSWWASYTLSEASDRIDGTDVARSWDQRHALQGGVHWSNEVWDIAAAASVHSGWPTTGLTLEQRGIDADGEPVYVAVPGARNELHHTPFASLDFRVSRKFDVRRGTLTAFIEVSNALNRRNVCCIDWDLADNPQGGPALENSEDYWLPLLPAIGVLWEF